MTTLPPDWSDFGLTDASLDWQEAGLCAQTDPEAFFPEPGGSVAEAKRVCAVCPVRAECLAYALANDETHGVWGGTSGWDRRHMEKPLRTVDAVKVCTGCETERPRTEFYRTGKGGLKTRCKVCVTAAKRQAYAEQRDAGAA